MSAGGEAMVPAALAPTNAMQSIATIAKTVAALIQKGDHAAEKAEQYYKAAGLHLATAKASKPADVTWPVFVRKHFNLGQERADELIRIGDGRTSLAEVRAKQATQYQRRKRINKSRVVNPESSAPAAPDPEAERRAGRDE